MKLERVVLKNFRGYRDETPIEIADLTALIGRNDAGKSIVLEALEIFFNNALVVCEREDLSINATSQNIEISCDLSEIPADVIIDAASPTDLGEECLLNRDGLLRIKKVFTATAAKPKPKIYFCCEHPTVDGASDLLELKRTDLRARANQLGIDPQEYNGNRDRAISRPSGFVPGAHSRFRGSWRVAPPVGRATIELRGHRRLRSFSGCQ